MSIEPITRNIGTYVISRTLENGLCYWYISKWNGKTFSKGSCIGEVGSGRASRNPFETARSRAHERNRKRGYDVLDDEIYVNDRMRAELEGFNLLTH